MESREEVTGFDVSHVRPVVVAHAPALFFIPCHDSACRDGGYDITGEMVRGIRNRETHITGEKRCMGNTGNGSCTYTLRFDAKATYRAP